MKLALVSALVLAGACRKTETSTEVRVVVFDIAVPTADLKRSLGVKASDASTNFLPAFEEKAGCGKALVQIEPMLEGMITGTQAPAEAKAEPPEVIEHTLYRAHPFHLSELITKDADGVVLALFGSHDPDPADEKDTAKYVERLHTEFGKFRELLASFRPAFVSYSQSDSLEEIRDDLLSVDMKPADAEAAAQRIYTTFAEEWTRTLAEFPDVTFVVSAGNGGSAGIGYKLEPHGQNGRGAMPASLVVKNLIVAGSYRDAGGSPVPSRFSNYGSLVQVYAKAERVEAASGCAERPRVKLTGTSQATAMVTNFLVKERKQGRTPQEALARLAKARFEGTEFAVLKD